MTLYAQSTCSMACHMASQGGAMWLESGIVRGAIKSTSTDTSVAHENRSWTCGSTMGCHMEPHRWPPSSNKK